MESYPHRLSLTILIVLTCGVLGVLQLPAQKIRIIPVQKAAPKVGLAMDTRMKNKILTTRFENKTPSDLAILYGAEKFKLKPGGVKEVPVPNQVQFDLRIFEDFGHGDWRERCRGKSKGAPGEHFAPLHTRKPNKAA